MTDSPVRFGLIGCGAWGSHHAQAIEKTKGAHLVAIAEHAEESRAAAREVHANADVVADYRELVQRDDLDVVSVVVPNRMHHEVGSAVLASAKHLLLEKPMCLSVAMCLAAQLSAESGRPVMMDEVIA